MHQELQVKISEPLLESLYHSFINRSAELKLIYEKLNPLILNQDDLICIISVAVMPSL